MATELSAAYSASNDLTCPLIDKVPPEVRVRIYRFLWSTWDSDVSSAREVSDPSSVSSITNRRIYWKHHATDCGSLPKLGKTSNLEDDFHDDKESDVQQNTDASDVEEVSDVEDNPLVEVVPRLRSTDTALFRVCRLLYAEAQFELLARSTVVVEVGNLEELTMSRNLLTQLRQIEIRDHTNSYGCIVISYLEEKENFESEEELEVADGIAQFQQIRSLLEQAPLLNSIVVGLKVLRVTSPFFSLLEMRFDRHSRELQRQMDYISARAGLGPFVCTGLGIWRSEFGEHSKVQIKHFNAISNIARCLAASPCTCGGDEDVWERHLSLVTYDWETELIFLRHRAAKYGLLGEEARKRCGGRDSMKSASWLRKTWVMIGFAEIINLRSPGW